MITISRKKARVKIAPLWQQRIKRRFGWSTFVQLITAMIATEMGRVSAFSTESAPINKAFIDMGCFYVHKCIKFCVFIVYYWSFSDLISISKFRVFIELLGFKISDPVGNGNITLPRPTLLQTTNHQCNQPSPTASPHFGTFPFEDPPVWPSLSVTDLSGRL